MWTHFLFFLMQPNSVEEIYMKLLILMSKEGIAPTWRKVMTAHLTATSGRLSQTTEVNNSFLQL